MRANDQLKNELLERLRAEGFDAAGIADAEAPPERAIRLNAFLGAGWHGEMAWLAKRALWRGDPRALWPEAKSAIVVGMSYAPRADPLELLTHREEGVISVYAQGTDYHDVLKKKLKRVASWLATESNAGVKVFVDTAPVMEKPLAQMAGIGWQGKHTNLVSREQGSWLFLGVIVSAYEFEVNKPHEDRCGNCHACLDICPTKAFPAPYQLDARRCISYLTIEHSGPIPHEFRKAIGNRIYGCDDCLAVCPWNKFAERARESSFHARAELRAPLLRDLAALDDAAFRKLFAGSAIKRIGRDQFIRNVLIAIGNSDDPALVECAQVLTRDASPLVRGAAVWALSQLLSPDAFASFAAENAQVENDETVRAEWLL